MRKLTIAIGLFLSFSFSSAFAAVPTDGLVGQYPLTTDASDTSGNANHGTVSNVSFSSDGATFNGSNSIISIPSLNSSTRTVSFWVKINALNPYDFQSFYVDATASNGITEIMYYNNTIYADVFVSSSQVQYPVDLSSGFHHIVWTQNNSVLSLYVDNVLVGNGSFIYPGNYGVYSTIGAYKDSNNPGGIRFLNGTMKNYRMYNRALSSSEVSDIYSADNYVPTPSTPTTGVGIKGAIDAFGSGAVAGATATASGPLGTIVYVLLGVVIFFVVGGMVIYGIRHFG